MPMQRQIVPIRNPFLIFLLACGLAACGGGGGTSSGTPTAVPSTAATEQTAQTVSANSTAVPSAGTTASATILETTAVVVASGQASATVTCPGGGSAVYQVTGPSLALITNGKLDTGENYTLTFNACKGEAGAASVTGVTTLDVISAGPGSLTVNTTTNGVVVALPGGTVTLNGSSALTRTSTTTGAVVTTVDHWTTANFSIATAFNGRSSTFTLSNVDITRTLVTTSGTTTSTTYSGSSTLAATLPNGSFSITLTTQGATTYDVTGVPTQGTWTLTLPNNTITLTLAGGTATVAVDYGSDGTIDKTYSYLVAVLVAAAG